MCVQGRHIETKHRQIQNTVTHNNRERERERERQRERKREREYQQYVRVIVPF